MNFSQEQNFRFERKFWLDNVTKQELELYVKQSVGGFSEIFWERQINNIYFDTPNLQNYLDNVSGSTNRRKIRIRWYDNLEGRVSKPVLEFKIKKGLVGTKLSFPLKPFTFKQGLSKQELDNIFKRSKLPPDIIEQLNIVEPVLVNSYSRKYFSSKDEKFRATIDTNLNFRKIGNLGNNFITKYRYNLPVILELKYENGEGENLGNITQGFPFRMSKSSKYVTGINIINNIGY